MWRHQVAHRAIARGHALRSCLPAGPSAPESPWLLASLAALQDLRHLDLSLCSQLADEGLALQHSSSCATSSSMVAPTLQTWAWRALSHCNKDCDITDEGLVSIAELQMLQYLNLRYCCELIIVGPMSNAAFWSLQYLDLGFCDQLSDDGLVNVSTLKQLQHLVLTHCDEITDAGLESVVALQELRHLSIAYCVKLRMPAL